MPTHFLILGGDSDHNLGDHAILYSLCLALLHWVPNARITVTSALPREHVMARAIPGVVDVIPRGARGFIPLLASARRCDRVVLGGGGLLQDDDSRVKMPYWAGRLALMSLMNSSMASISLGAGPIRRAESRLWARWAARSLNTISVRDPLAAESLQSALGRPVAITPDPAFLLPTATDTEAKAYLQSVGLQADRPIIGVSLRHWFHRRGGLLPRRYMHRLGLGRGSGEHIMEACLDELAEGVRELSRMLHAQVLFMPSYPLPNEGDLLACLGLRQRLPGLRSALARTESPLLYKALCRRLSLMISARMHPLIMAAGVGVPIVGLGYNDKFRGLFDMLDSPPRLIPLDDFRHGRANAGTLVGHALAAMREDCDLAARAESLGARVLDAVGKQVVARHREEEAPA